MLKTSILKRFRDDKRGSAYVMAALAIVPMFGMMALAVDVTNHDRIKTDLETAAQTVALHIAKRVALDPNRDADEFVTEGKAIFASLVGVPITYDRFSVDMATGKVQIIAKTDVDTHFMHMFGQDTLSATTKTQAQFGRENIEVAISIDNSGSMRHSGGTVDGVAVTKIGAAKLAAHALVASATDSVADLSNADLKISVIPWTTHVKLPNSELRKNSGSAATVNGNNWKDWIDWDGYSVGHYTYLAPYKKDQGDMYYVMPGDDPANQDHDEWDRYDPKEIAGLLPLENGDGGVHLTDLKAKSNIGLVTRKDVFKKAGIEFGGCFEHRAGDYRFSFSAPTGLDSISGDPSDNIDFDGNSLFVPAFAPDERDGWSSRNDYLNDLQGNSDWIDGDTDDENHLENVESARVFNTAKYAENSSTYWNVDSDDNPNGRCDTVAEMLPLSDDSTAIADAIDGMTSVGGVYTDLTIGLEWAMHSLTSWAPLEQAGSYNDARKIMVFMTDGVNDAGQEDQYYSSYGSFGYPVDDLLHENMGTQSAPLDSYNLATKEYCTLIKNQGVKVYFIYYGSASTASEELATHCASTPESKILATNSEALVNAFEKIGDDIGKLRLTHYTD